MDIDIKQNRFVDLESRPFSSVIYHLSTAFLSTYIRTIKHTKWNKFKWKGRTLMKDPMTLSIYMQLFQDIRPKTILEFGTFDGGSALWMEDFMKIIDNPCIIHTFDINQERVSLGENSKVKFHKLDNHSIQDFVLTNPHIFENLERPVVMIEDSHENTKQLIISIDNFLRSDDYLIIEDTLDLSKYNQTIGANDFKNKLNYQIDTYYCDFWGMNNSWNFNSFLKKV